MNKGEGTLKVTVHDGAGQKASIKGAVVLVSVVGTTGVVSPQEIKAKAETDANGQALFQLKPNNYSVAVETFKVVEPKPATVEADKDFLVDLPIPIGLDLEIIRCPDEARQNAYPELILSGTPVRAHIRTQEMDRRCKDFRTKVKFQITTTCGSIKMTGERQGLLDTTGLTGPVTLSATLTEVNTSSMTVSQQLHLLIPVEGAHNQYGDLPWSTRRLGLELEFLKERRKNEKRQATISELKGEMEALLATVKEQAAQIQRVIAQLELEQIRAANRSG